MSFQKIVVVGLGYIGLPTAAAFAARRKQVLGVDINQRVVDVINRGEIYFVEPELDIVVNAAVSGGYLRAATEVEPADAFLIAVPTPFKEGNRPDMSYIEAAVKSIAPVLKRGDLVVLESTCPVGTTAKLAQWLSEERPDLTFPVEGSDDIDVCVSHCPERVLPGSVVRELVQNNRVIGGLTERCATRSIELYKTFVEGEFQVTSARTAELAKLVENAYRDVNIAFANEISMVCDKLDVPVWELIEITNQHPRVNVLQPGPGVGGHCIAVDPWFIVDSAPESTDLIRAARKINDYKPRWVFDKVKAACFEAISLNPGLRLEDLSIACFGLAFKADIDDLRESPALELATRIMAMNTGKTLVVEPNLTALPESLQGAVFAGRDEALQAAHVLVFLVDHKSFFGIDTEALAGKVVVDTKGLIYKPN